MLAAYFDDSGTHSSSKMVVWGGVIGTSTEFARLEEAWGRMLSEPLPGKPPLRKFSVGDCAWGRDEFIGYKPAERDALRYDVRKIIGDSGVRSVAYTIPVPQYRRILKGRPLRAYGPPDSMAFASCADLAMQVSKRDGRPLACVFDKGQENERLHFYIEHAEKRAVDLEVAISYSFAPVLGTPGLQAADTVATEHYWYALECLKANPPVITPHFASLIEMMGPDGFVLLEPELTKLRKEFLAQYPLKSWIANHRLRDIWERFTR